MKQRLGGVLSLALGAVFIAGGSLDGGSSGAVGSQLPSCQSASAGITVPCPVGVIDITESAAAPAVVHPAVAPTSWTVTVTSANCTAPDGSTLDETVVVPDGGSASSEPLFVYSNSSHDDSCSYTLSVAAVAGYTTTLTPSSPVTIPFDQSRAGSVRNVALAVTAPVVTTTPPPPTSTAPSTPASSAPASSASATAGPTVSSEPTDVTSSAVATSPVANTGPHSSVPWTILVGVALCLLGLVLLVGGRTRRVGPSRS